MFAFSKCFLLLRVYKTYLNMKYKKCLIFYNQSNLLQISVKYNKPMQILKDYSK